MKGILRARRYYTRHDWKELLLPTWQVGLALVAILDILNCWSIMMNAWAAGGDDDTNSELVSPAAVIDDRNNVCFIGENVSQPSTNDTCAASSNNHSSTGTSQLVPTAWILPAVISLPSRISTYIGPIFCLLCIINGVIRARRAQQLAYENAALDVFETKLASLCSTARCSFAHRGSGGGLAATAAAAVPHQQIVNDLDHELAHKTLRIWGPVAAQLTLWFVLIPWASCCFWTKYNCEDIIVFFYKKHFQDSAILSIWMSQTLDNMRFAFRTLETQAWTLFWKRVRQTALRSPIKLYLKFRQLFRWIRFIRYAGPLLRMLDKVQMHSRALIRTWRQTRAAKNTKLQKIQCRDGIKKDIQRVASAERMNRTIRSMKSQMFKHVPTHYKNLLQRSVGDTLAVEKKQRAKIKRQVEDLSHNASWGNISEVYDQLVDLTQEVTSSVRKEVLNSHLIPPNTRFSVAWRVIISVALVLELLRLWASWKAHGDYTVPLAELLKHWFVTCDPDGKAIGAAALDLSDSPTKQLQEKAKEFLLASGRFLTFGKVKFVDKQKRMLLIEQCFDASYTATLAQQIGLLVGNAIDIVCFLDIFVWFNTGELDVQGNVVPKPFFSRCILPGTLVQVFDHPTLPTVLPTLFLRLLGVVEAVGFGRVIRWGLVLEPAFNLLVLDQLKAYVLSPADEGGDFSFFSSSIPNNSLTYNNNNNNSGILLDDFNSNGSLITAHSSSWGNSSNSFLNKYNNHKGSNPTLKKNPDSMIFNNVFIY